MVRRTRGISKSVHSANQGAFCELMIAARKNAGLTQHELAKRLRKPQSFVAKYEGGERRIDVVEFLAIVRAMGADPVHLIRALMRRTAS
jgi:transcriptional regulator with XRE-family HTH domain